MTEPRNQEVEAVEGALEAIAAELRAMWHFGPDDFAKLERIADRLDSLRAGGDLVRQVSGCTAPRMTHEARPAEPLSPSCPDCFDTGRRKTTEKHWVDCDCRAAEAQRGQVDGLTPAQLAELVNEAANWASGASQLRPGGQVESLLEAITIRLILLVAAVSPDASAEIREQALRRLASLHPEGSK